MAKLNKLTKFNIKELLDFFDDKKNSQKGDAAAFSALFGEDLNAAVYKDFKENIEVLEDPVVSGTRRGQRLDRWFVDKKNKKLFQCEIKNWSATAIGGRRLRSNPNDGETKEIIIYYWEKETRNRGNLSENPTKPHPNLVTKVLLKMRPPRRYENFKIEPLVIYWMPISSDKKEFNPLSRLSVKSLNLPIKSDFKDVHIFSVSLYLHKLHKKGKGKKYIYLDVPHFEHRMKLLERFKK